MNIIYFGALKNLKGLVPIYISMYGDQSTSEFRKQLEYCKGRPNISVVVHLPLSNSRQNVILKFAEEFKGKFLVLFSNTIDYSIIPTIRSRFIVKLGDVSFDKKMMSRRWENQFNIPYRDFFFPYMNRVKSSSLELFFSSLFLYGG